MRTSIEYISKNYPRIWMKVAEYVEFATLTNRLHIDQDPISEPYLSHISEIISI